jgi:hypothetical protein
MTIDSGGWIKVEQPFVFRNLNQNHRHSIHLFLFCFCASMRNVRRCVKTKSPAKRQADA